MNKFFLKLVTVEVNSMNRLRTNTAAPIGLTISGEEGFTL